MAQGSSVSMADAREAWPDWPARQTALNLNRYNLATTPAPRLFLTNPVAMACARVARTRVAAKSERAHAADDGPHSDDHAPLVAGPSSIARVTRVGDDIAGKAPRGIAITSGAIALPSSTS